MRPSYEQLVALNPRLRTKTPQDVEALLNVIELYGYGWNARKGAFYSAEIAHAVGSQGLDLLTPEGFRDLCWTTRQKFLESHPPIAPGQLTSYRLGYADWDPAFVDPQSCRMYRRAERWGRRLFALGVLDLLGGWKAFSTEIWLGSFVVIATIWALLKRWAWREGERVLEEHDINLELGIRPTQSIKRAE